MSAVGTIESNQAQIHHLEAELAKLDCAVGRNIMDMIDEVALAHPRERAALREYMPDARKQILLDAYIDLRSEAAFSPLMGPLFRLSGTAVTRSKWLVSEEDPFGLTAQAINTARINFRNRGDNYRDHVVTVANYDALEAIAARAGHSGVDVPITADMVAPDNAIIIASAQSTAELLVHHFNADELKAIQIIENGDTRRVAKRLKWTPYEERAFRAKIRKLRELIPMLPHLSAPHVTACSGVAEAEPENDAGARIDGEIERRFNWVTISRKLPGTASDTEFESATNRARRRALVRRLTDDERGALDMSVTSDGMLEKLDALRACPGAWRKSALWCNPLPRPVPRA